MASFPPEHPESHSQAEPLDQAPAEPRLLTRRNADDHPDESPQNGNARPAGSSKNNAAGQSDDSFAAEPFSGTLSPRSRQRHFYRLRSLASLRARIGRRRPSSGVEHDLQVHKPQVRPFAGLAVRRITNSLLALAILCILALLSFTLFLRHDMRAALPQLDGDLHLAGLTAPVTVTRDAQGVPNIQAATLDDVLFAQGFVTAQDRLWQMDALRRHAAGELAEILGSSMVEHDRQQRILQLRAAADRAVLTLPPDQLAQLQAYARGVNSFLESQADHLPVEFHLLHYTPAPWTPRDTLLVYLAMFQDLATSFPTKLRREALAQHLPPELLADLYPTRSWRDQPPTQPPPDLTAPKPEIEQIPLDDTQVKLGSPHSVPELAAPSDLLASLPGYHPYCAECRAGSNNWAVSGQHTASGKPLVSNDMHLSLGLPDIWYEAGLHTTAAAAEPALDVVGFTLPGVPFVIVGRNAHIAWSVTNLLADVQDLHKEHLRGSGDNTEFQQPDGSWLPVAHHRELIRVRGGHNRDLDVLTTTAHIGSNEIDTPIISPLYPTEHRALSLLWTPYDPHNLLDPFYAVDTATSGAALVASLAGFGGPALNLVYADDAGHIGYHAIGRVPIRGPAVHHPRALPPSIVAPTGAAPPDEDQGNDSSSDPAQPQAWLNSTAGRFLPAGYAGRRPRRSRRREAPAPADAAPSLKSVPEEPIPPAPPLRDYTIGSPLPTVPVDALDATTQWSGYVPFEELPAALDPADGILATANARITSDDYPYFLADDWLPPYRVERIRKLLAGRNGLTPADMLRIETDTTSAFDRLLGERLTYALDHASPHALGREAKRLRQAADLLRTWAGKPAGAQPGDMTPNSPAAAIVAATRAELWPMLIAPQIALHDHLKPNDSALPELTALYAWEGQTVALETLLTFQPARWLPPGFANWNDFLAIAVARGLAESGAPGDLHRWTYGSLHQVEIDHPIFRMSPLLARLVGARIGSGAEPIGGDSTTVDATGRAYGPSERFTADLADPGATTGNITTGESGNPRDPHYLDQFPAWLRGATFSMPLNGAPAQHTFRLLP